MKFGLLYEMQRPLEDGVVNYKKLVEEQHRESGADQLMMVMQTDQVNHEQVLNSIELFGTHVVPRFRD